MPPVNPKVSALLELIDQKLSGKKLSLIHSLVPKYWSLVAYEELENKTTEALLECCQRHLQLANRRQAKQHLIRISQNPKDPDSRFVEIVIEDMPFLFDSLSNAFHSQGMAIRLANHPVLWIKRSAKGVIEEIASALPKAAHFDEYKAESWLRFELDTTGVNLSNAALEKILRGVLKDVSTVVNGWQKMRSKAAEIRFGLEKPHLPIDDSERRQACEFLEWMENNNLTFVSYTRARHVVDKEGKADLKDVPSTRLGLKIEASPWQQLTEDSHGRGILGQYLNSKSLLVITKANQRSPVHRNAYLDYIAIKDYDKSGQLRGEHRFFGLFTRAAYNSRALDIPLLADRINDALHRAQFPAGSHNAKMLLQILETFPRDEQFQYTVDELYQTAMGVLALDERDRVRLFCRIDTFRRFYSFLIYIPRDRYSQSARERIQTLISEKTGSNDLSFQIHLSESNLARLQIIARVGNPAEALNTCELEHAIEHITQSWQETLRTALLEKAAPKQASDLLKRYLPALPPVYASAVSPQAAVQDLLALDELQQTTQPLIVRLSENENDQNQQLQIRCYFSQQPLALAEAQPRLANLGLRLELEDLYPIGNGGSESAWIQNFRVSFQHSEALDLESSAALFEEAFLKVYTGECEDDDFNRLTLAAQITYREVGALRAYSRYLKQLGIRFGQDYISQTLFEHSAITRSLIALFDCRFNPATTNRDQQQQVMDDALLAALDQVSSLDADRILRSFRNLIMATLRCNYYQASGKTEFPATYAFKLAVWQIPEAPSPRPRFEIWVHSPDVEAVHLRGDKVARGGLRWSDRPEDFRTEVLGLVKAQMVKNAVIVPVGAKGGFVCRNMPATDDRAEKQAYVIECYKQFISSMLSLTDNLVKGKLQRPNRVVCHDDDDPYLVVAADKGTATFSDIANSVSAQYNFWIGDAFASGGSNGYDHKKMGITARGAWESVKRHFRELNKDIQNEDFTVVAIGDMAGDVFGNGMLLSEHIKLVAAFNHQHIFIDPNPDAKKSFKERQRLFKLPRSSWEDYRTELISSGGAIFSRSAKTLKPSKQACEALDIRQKNYTPDELIHEILKAPVELLWNGGIGTYAKAETESDEQAGDRANDSVRVNASQLRCKVIGEGGNLGITQAGRIEYSLHGGLCNTDFIDNSGGVDSSDAEVNIKIALNAAMAEGSITFEQRNKLLRDMTEDVKFQVLRNNYLQTQAISILSTHSNERLGEQAELIRLLERDAGLHRKQEMLPDEKVIQQRQSGGIGLTRPELSTLLSHSKIDLYRALLDSDVPQDPYLSRELMKAFPSRMQKRYQPYIESHPLRSEIICTRITNSLINRMGTAFARRLKEESGTGLHDIARAYTIARDAFRIRPLWNAIETLDNVVPADLQLHMLILVRRLLKHLTLWLINSGQALNDIESMVDTLSGDVVMLEKHVCGLLSTEEQERVAAKMNHYVAQGVPSEIATRITLLKALYPLPDINQLAQQSGISSLKVAQVYFALADRLDLTWIRRHIEHLKADSRWRALARAALRDDLYFKQRKLTALVLQDIQPKKKIAPQVDKWFERNAEKSHYLTNLTLELKSADNADYLSLSVLLRQIDRLLV